MRYGLGVDLGTATVGAAVLGPEGVEPVVLGERSVRPARGRARHARTGRCSPATPPSGGRSYAPQCTARSLRRALREPDPVLLDGRPYQVVDLLAAILRDVVATVAIERQATPDLVTLTRPATWGRARVAQLAEVAARAGVPGAAIVTDAQAAVVHYAAEGRLPLGGRVAVFDFGGGGFEAAVLALEPDGVHLVGPPEGIEPLGGVDIDRLLLNFLDARLGGPLAGLDPLDGRGATLRERNRAECCLAKEQLVGRHRGRADALPPRRAAAGGHHARRRGGRRRGPGRGGDHRAATHHAGGARRARGSARRAAGRRLRPGCRWWRHGGGGHGRARPDREPRRARRGPGRGPPHPGGGGGAPHARASSGG